jgi:hypothetical protein
MSSERGEWTFAQWGIVVLATVQLAWALAGFIAEPSIHFGAGAPTERVLGIDFNGVHAISGLLLFAPAYFFARRPDWAVWYAIYVMVALFTTGIWALFAEQPAWVFNFPNNGADAVLHIATGLLFGAVALIQTAIDGGLPSSEGAARPRGA